MPHETHDLIDRAVSTLREALVSPELSLHDRAMVALRVLELTQGIRAIAPRSAAEPRTETPLDHDQNITQGIASLSNLSSSNLSSSNLSARDVSHDFRSSNLHANPVSPKNKLIRSPGPQFSQAPGASILSPQVVQIDNFLSPEIHQYALQTALTKANQFVASQTTTNADDYRRSSILYATLYPNLYDLLRQRLLDWLPRVLDELGLDHFSPGQVEMQLTAHNDGCFYKIHNDSGSPETETRILTYVYYFYQEPKQFSGGELRLYETDINGSMVTPSDCFNTIEPVNNRIVFFDSRCKHEVLPVACPSRSFPDSRFTLNGWLRSV